MIKKDFWLEKNKCTGCGACKNVCPKNAIDLLPDEYGFIYPIIGNDCINCGLCEMVCKKRGEITSNNRSPEILAGWTLDPQIRYTSTSGGVFSELAKVVLSSNGVVFGATYNEEMLVAHTCIRSNREIASVSQSKYLQSSIGETYKNAKKELVDGVTVLFCGTPCQIAGLYAFLGKKYSNLITMDFICRGVNSPKAFKSWITEIETIEGKKIKKVWFKYKEDGWKASPKCTRIDFDDGSYKVYKGEKNLYMSAYLGPNLFIRPCCGECDFKSFPRLADLTVGDFWKIDASFDNDCGTSMIMVNTIEGHTLLEKAKQSLELYEQNIDDIFDGNVCINNSVNINPRSEAFLKELDTLPFSKAVKLYTNDGLLIKIKRKIKRLFVRNTKL